MTSSLAIGDFSRATHLNIKTLRHYHRIGLLVPVHVDPDTAPSRRPEPGHVMVIIGHSYLLESILPPDPEDALGVGV
jgi:hypothetical protein